MKQLFISILLLQSLLTAIAQAPSSTSFDVDGIKVIYKPTVKNVINVSIYFRGGVGNYTAGMAGIEKLAVQGAIDCGNARYTNNEFKDKSDLYGIEIAGNATLDNARIKLNCISKYFNEGWDLLTSAVTHPVFDENAFEKLKQKLLSEVKQQESNPDSKLRSLALQTAFAATPYATDPDGTEASLTSLTRPAVSEYYTKTLLNRSRIFIVVVGNISKEEISSKIRTAFSSIPAAEYKAYLVETPAFSDNAVFVEDRPLATNYILGVVNAPSYTSPDYVPFLLAFSELHGMLFTEIRSRRNLSYAPDATLHPLLMPYGDVYVSTTNPKEAVKVIANVINQEQGSNITKKSLSQIKALYITGSYLREENTDALAENLGRAETLGNWEIAEQLPAIVDRTTRNDMSKAFKKYIVGIKWTYLGDKTKADEAMNSFNISVK